MVMMIYLSPQGLPEDIEYEFEEGVVTATYKGVTNSFDFRNVPDGELQLHDDEGRETIETDLEINPISSSKKEDGVLWIELLNNVTDEYTEAEKFPEWIEHTEYSPPAGEEDANEVED